MIFKPGAVEARTIHNDSGYTNVFSIKPLLDVCYLENDITLKFTTISSQVEEGNKRNFVNNSTVKRKQQWCAALSSGITNIMVTIRKEDTYFFPRLILSSDKAVNRVLEMCYEDFVTTLRYLNTLGVPKSCSETLIAIEMIETEIIVTIRKSTAYGWDEEFCRVAFGLKLEVEQYQV